MAAPLVAPASCPSWQPGRIQPKARPRPTPTRDLYPGASGDIIVGYVENIEFRPIHRTYLCVWLVTFGLAFLGLGLGGLLSGPRFSASRVGVLVLCVLCLMAAASMLNTLAGWTVIDDEGLRTGTLLRRRACRWTDVRRIDLKRRRYRNGTRTDIIIRLQSGGRIKLPAPYISPNEHDPNFQLKVQQITERWITHAGRPIG